MTNINLVESKLQLAANDKEAKKKILITQEWGKIISSNLLQYMYLTPNVVKTFINHAPFIQEYWNSYKRVIKELDRSFMLIDPKSPIDMSDKNLIALIDCYVSVMHRLDKCDYENDYLIEDKWPGKFKRTQLFSKSEVQYWGLIKNLKNIRKSFLIKPSRYIDGEDPIVLIFAEKSFSSSSLENINDYYVKKNLNIKQLPVYVINIDPKSKQYEPNNPFSGVQINKFTKRRILESEYKQLKQLLNLKSDRLIALFQELFSGPNKKTIDYLRKKIRRTLRQVKTKNRKLYSIIFFRYLSKIKQSEKINYSKRWLLSDFLFEEKDIKHLRNGRGNLVLPDSFKKQKKFTKNLDLFSLSYGAISDFLKGKKILPIELEIFILDMLENQGHELNLKNTYPERVNRLLESKSKETVKTVFNSLAKIPNLIFLMDPSSIAKGLIDLDRKILKKKIINEIKKTDQKKWKVRFIFEYDQAIFNFPSKDDLIHSLSFDWPGRIENRKLSRVNFFPPDNKCYKKGEINLYQLNKNKKTRQNEFEWPSKFRPSISKSKKFLRINTLGVSSGYLGWTYAIHDYLFLKNLLKKNLTSTDNSLGVPQANSNDIGINAEKYLDALSDERLIDITEIAEYEWQCKSCSGYKNHSDFRISSCERCSSKYAPETDYRDKRRSSGAQAVNASYTSLTDEDIPF